MSLVTRFLLDPSNYVQGAKLVESTTRQVTGVIEGLRSGIVSGLQSALRAVFNPIAALAGGAGIAALAHQAVTAAIGFDTISRSLEAVTGSAERAKAVLAFDDRLAGPSIFTSEDLAQASLTLEAFKLKTEQFLPVVEKIATVFGGNTEALRQFTDALGYIANGRFGEGFESLTRAGFSRADFEAKGLTFDKGGEFTGQAEDALKAITELTTERFGKLSEAMASGPAAKFASVMDAIGRAARVAGFAILTVLMPAAQKVGGFIEYLVSSGAIEKAISGITRLFNGATIGDTLVKAIAYLVATIQELPTIFMIVRTAAEGFFSFIRDNLKTIGALFIAAFVFGPIVEGLGLLVVAINAVRRATSLAEIAALALQAGLGGAAALAKVLIAAGAAYTIGLAAMNQLDSLAGQAMDLGPVQALTKESDRIGRRASGILGGFGGGNGQGPTGTAGTIVNTLSTLLSPTKQIADYTGRTAKAAEKLANVNDAIIGGGQVGRGATGGVNTDKALREADSGGGDEADQIATLIRRMVNRTAGGMIVEDGYRRRTGR